MRLVHVAATAPDLMRVAEVMEAFARAGEQEQLLVHTGPPFRDDLARHLFQELGLPKPRLSLGIGAGSRALRTGRGIIAVEPTLRRADADWVFTIGDAEAILAAALVAAKLGLRVARLEAGLRSHEPREPEEINRTLTDRLAHALLTSEPSARENLLREGVAENLIHPVGSLTIDVLDRFRERATEPALLGALGLEPRRYVIVLLQRAADAEDASRLRVILQALGAVTAESACPAVVPMPQRLSAVVRAQHLEPLLAPLHLLRPLGYLEHLVLLESAGAVVTDSGPVQEESTVLGVPCVTLRRSTERPITVTRGTNRLVDGDLGELPDVIRLAMGSRREPRRPELWDGRTAERVVEAIQRRGPTGASDPLGTRPRPALP